MPQPHRRPFEMEPRKGKRGSSDSPQSAESGDSAKKHRKVALYQKLLNDKETIWNFIPKLPPSYRKDSRFSNILDLNDTLIDLKTQQLVDSDGNVLLQRDENIYMVSEPPGEPYYVGRVVEFVTKPEFAAKVGESAAFITSFPSKFFNVRMNWYYRSRDIQEKIITPNPRLLYASLHQDICPISSYRGKCTVVHKDELLEVLPNIRESIVRSNVFYFDSLFDRYTKLYYKIYPTDKLLHQLDVKSSYLYALNKRFRYVYVEEKYPLLEVLQRYALESNSVDDSHYKWDRRCTVCKEWTNQNDSLQCDECNMTLHLYCMDPPLEKKLGKSVIWVCYTCLQRNENTKTSLKEVAADEREMKQFIMNCKRQIKLEAENLTQRNKIEYNKYNCWFQYLGQYVVSHLVDAIKDSVFLPYPFKPSRFGQKYQWSHCLDSAPFEKKPYIDSSSDQQTHERGLDATVTLSWKLNHNKITSAKIDEYVEKCKNEIPASIGIIPENCNFLDFITKALVDKDYNTQEAFECCENVITRDILNEPTFTADEIERFEKSVKKHGSELRPVWKDVGTQSMPMIVRLFYNWKKTERGRKIRGKHQKLRKLQLMKEALAKEQGHSNQNKHKKTPPSGNHTHHDLIPTLASKQNEIEMRYMDDSSFDIDSLGFSNTSFHCLFCNVGFSAMWYKVTGGTDDENIKSRMQTGVNEKTELSDKPHTAKKPETQKLGALCIRCTRLWRRYAVKWSQPLEIVRRMYGTSAGTYNNAIETILQEEDINKITLSAEQAKAKYLEWENVQDAELIIRQRLEMIDNPKKLKNLVNWSSSLHTKQVKHIIKPHNKYDFDPDHMQYDLNSYVESKKPPEPNNLTKSTSKESVVSMDSENSQPIETLFIKNPERTSQKRRPQIKNGGNSNNADLNDKRKSPLSEKDDEFCIKTYFNTKNRQKLKIEIDRMYQNIKLDQRIIDDLISSSVDDSEKLLTKIIKRSKKENADILESTTLTQTDVFSPILAPNFSDDRTTSYTLGAYRKMINRCFENGIHNEQDNAASEINYPKISSVDQVCSSLRQGRNYCCVCRENFDNNLDRELVCINCGLNLHSSCYGITQYELSENRNQDRLPWLCDPCANEANPVISTHYECSLCYSKGKSHIDDKSGPQPECPDALKPTINGGWCHVICSLFDENVKYCSSKNLAPAVNINYTLYQNRDKQCNLCNLSGGSITKVINSDINCHPVCAQQDSRYKLMFAMELVNATSNGSNSEIIINKNDGTSFTLFPVVIDNENELVNDKLIEFHHLSAVIGEKSLLELYATTSKQNATKNVILSKYFEQQQIADLDSFEDDLLLQLDHLYSVPNKMTIIGKEKLCKNCKQSDCVFWYSADLCHLCHLDEIKENDKLIEQSTSKTFDDTLVIQPISSSFAKQLLEGVNYNTCKLPSK